MFRLLEFHALVPARKTFGMNSASEALKFA